MNESDYTVNPELQKELLDEYEDMLMTMFELGFSTDPDIKSLLELKIMNHNSLIYDIKRRMFPEQVDSPLDLLTEALTKFRMIETIKADLLSIENKKEETKRIEQEKKDFEEKYVTKEYMDSVLVQMEQKYISMLSEIRETK